MDGTNKAGAVGRRKLRHGPVSAYYLLLFVRRLRRQDAAAGHRLVKGNGISRVILPQLSIVMLLLLRRSAVFALNAAAKNGPPRFFGLLLLLLLLLQQ